MLILETLWNKADGALETGPKGETIFCCSLFLSFQSVTQNIIKTTL